MFFCIFIRSPFNSSFFYGLVVPALVTGLIFLTISSWNFQTITSRNISLTTSSQDSVACDVVAISFPFEHSGNKICNPKNNINVCSEKLGKNIGSGTGLYVYISITGIVKLHEIFYLNNFNNSSFCF